MESFPDAFRAAFDGAFSSFASFRVRLNEFMTQNSVLYVLRSSKRCKRDKRLRYDVVSTAGLLSLQAFYRCSKHARRASTSLGKRRVLYVLAILIRLALQICVARRGFSYVDEMASSMSHSKTCLTITNCQNSPFPGIL